MFDNFDGLTMSIVDGVGKIVLSEGIGYTVEKDETGFNVVLNMDGNEVNAHITCNSLKVCEMKVSYFE